MKPIAPSLTRLRIHDVVKYQGRLHRVDLVNDCRARLRLIPSRERRTFVPATGPDAGKTISVPADSSEPISICPNSEIPIVGKWDSAAKIVRLGGEPAPAAQPEPAQPAEPEPVIEPLEQQTLL
jgi:hypothetical protein